MNVRTRSPMVLRVACIAVACLFAHVAYAVAPCSSLVGITLPSSSSATVTAATSITPPITLTGPAGTATITVPFCRVQGVATPFSDSYIEFEVWLPSTDAAWTGRLKAEANGDYLGGIPYPRMAQEIAEGFVEVGDDLGHEGTQSPSWDTVPDKVDDWGYRAHYYVATAAKAIVAAFYGRPPHHSYFDGCSGGGRQGHVLADRFPDLFDGILAGAPSHFYPDAILQLMWQNKLLLPAPEPAPQTVPAAKLSLLSSAVNAECDAKDGLADGQITDPRACHFDPGVLLCPGGDEPTCLTADELSIVREIYRGPHTSAGFHPARDYWPGPYPGSETDWIVNFADSQHFGNFTGDVVYDNTTWNYRTDLNFNTDYEYIKDVLTPLTSAPSPDLRAFKAHGGKMIQYDGWFDPVVTPEQAPDYYAALALFEKFGDDALDRVERESPAAIAELVATTHAPRDYFRLFMVPNMSHCGGGNGPNAFNESVSYPSPTPDAAHDAVLALIKWVEQGVPPDQIIATQYTNNNPKLAIVRQRPLCAYPDEARYNGTGDVNSASSFTCAAPDRKLLVPTAADLGIIRYSLWSRKLVLPTTQTEH